MSSSSALCSTMSCAYAVDVWHFISFGSSFLLLGEWEVFFQCMIEFKEQRHNKFNKSNFHLFSSLLPFLHFQNFCIEFCCFFFFFDLFIFRYNGFPFKYYFYNLLTKQILLCANRHFFIYVRFQFDSSVLASVKCFFFSFFFCLFKKKLVFFSSFKNIHINWIIHNGER